MTEHTIEENILAKSNQKRHMNDVVIGDGQFTTHFFDKLDPRELLGLLPTTESDLPSETQIARAMSSVEDHDDREGAKQASLEEESYLADMRVSDEEAARREDLEKLSSKKPRSRLEASLTPVQVDNEGP